MGDDHVLAADDVGGPQQHGEAQGLRGVQGLLQGGDAHPLGPADVQVFQQRVKPAPVLGHVDAVGGGAQDGDALLVQELGEGDGGLATEGHHHAHGLFHLDDPHHVLRGEGLEVQPVGGAVVGGAVVKLDALADADGAGPQDDDGLLPAAGEVPGVAVVVVGGVEVGGLGLELGGAGVHHLVAGEAVGEGSLLHSGQPSQHLVGVAVLLALEVGLRGDATLQALLKADQVLEFMDEELVDLGDLVDVVDAHPLGQGLKDGEQPQIVHGGQPLVQGAAGGVLIAEGVQLDLRPTDGLHQGGLKGVLNGHDLAGGLHLGAQLPAGPVELVKGPLGELHHHIVHGGLEAGVGLPGDVVLDLVQGVAQGDFGGDLGDGIPRGLGGQGGGPGDSGVDLDDGVLKAVGVQGKLAVAAAFNAQLLDDFQGGGAEHLVLPVGQGLGGGHHDGVAGVDAHGIDVLHGADGDDVAGGDGGALVVPHHLELDLLPPEDVLLDEHLGDGGVVQAHGGLLPQLGLVVGHTAAAAA